MTDAITEFRIDVPLVAGLPLEYLRDIVDYWANEYDWRAREARLNRVPQLMARLGYDRYFAQGGDWGSMVTSAIAMRDLDHCMGARVLPHVARGVIARERQLAVRAISLSS